MPRIHRFSISTYFIAALVTLGLAAPGAEAAGGRSLRALSYNVWGLPEPITPKKDRFRDLPAHIPAVDADIIGFQETFACAADVLGKMPEYPFVAWGPKEKGLRIDSGLLIVSRYPILEKATMVYSKCFGTDCVARKGMLYARIAVPGIGEVSVFNTHLNAEGSSRIRESQIEQAARFIEKHSGGRPTIFVGDFNYKPGSSPYEKLIRLTGLRDTHVEFVEKNPDLPPVVRNGYSFDPKRNNNPPRIIESKRIDFIMVRDERTDTIETERSSLAFETKIGGRFLSDHFGVIADLRILPFGYPSPDLELASAQTPASGPEAGSDGPGASGSLRFLEGGDLSSASATGQLD